VSENDGGKPLDHGAGDGRGDRATGSDDTSADDDAGRDADGAGPGGRDGEHGDLVLHDDAEKRPSWLSTYGSPLWRIVFLVALLAALVVLRKPCAEGMAGFVGNFGQPVGAAAPRDGAVRPTPTGGGASGGMTQRAGPASLPRHEGEAPAPSAVDAAPRH
jgi:hypothetical protein